MYLELHPHLYAPHLTVHPITAGYSIKEISVLVTQGFIWHVLYDCLVRACDSFHTVRRWRVINLCLIIIINLSSQVTQMCCSLTRWNDGDALVVLPRPHRESLRHCRIQYIEGFDFRRSIRSRKAAYSIEPIIITDKNEKYLLLILWSSVLGFCREARSILNVTSIIASGG